MDKHPHQWEQIYTAWRNKRIPQAMLLVGPLHCALSDFVMRLSQLVLCKAQNAPCLLCNDCQMIINNQHPDIEWVKAAKEGGAIKIDQVRELHHSAYLTPQRSRYRLIVIEAADRMNIASANALLKTLEEPAEHTLFILIAQQLSTVLPTVLSRCQIIPFSSSMDYSTNLLKLGEQYSKDSDRFLIINQAEPILDELILLIEGKQQPSMLILQWNQFELSTLLWFLYLVYAQLQRMYMVASVPEEPAVQQFNRLHCLLNPVLIFAQLDKINTLLRKLSHNMNINRNLVLEDLLFSLISDF